MNKAEALDKIEQLAYSYDKGKIESIREGINNILERYAQQRELIAFKNGWKAAEKLNGWNTNPHAQNQEDET